jgi:hypothetical protein
MGDDHCVTAQHGDLQEGEDEDGHEGEDEGQLNSDLAPVAPASVVHLTCIRS